MPPVIELLPTLIDMRYKYTSLPSSFAEFFTETVTERIGSMKHLALNNLRQAGNAKLRR